MSNTNQRIISALILVLIVGISAYVGVNGIKVLLLVAGVLLVDEVTANLLKVKRNHVSYLLAITSFMLLFVLFNFIDVSYH